MLDWGKIENLVGFGRRDAPVVFIGMEEGLRDASALAEDLAVRSAYPNSVMDLAEAHIGIAGTERYFDPERAPRQSTWRVMADLMARRAGIAQPDRIHRKRYRCLELGRSDQDALLMELLPYPSPGKGDWLYKQFGRYVTRKEYEADQLPKRLKLLRSVLNEVPRELILCYGKSDWPHFEKLFHGEVRFSDRGRFRVATVGDTRIVLTTHIGKKHFNTFEELAELEHIALRYRD